MLAPLQASDATAHDATERCAREGRSDSSRSFSGLAIYLRYDRRGTRMRLN
jgi:hypothetical protein